MLLILLSVCFFILGALCFYIPFSRLKKQILQIVPSSNTFSTEVELGKESEMDLLDRYIQNLKEEIKGQSNEIVFLQKKIESIADVSREAIIILDKWGKLLFHSPYSEEIFFLEEGKPVHYLNEMIRSPDVRSIFRSCVKQKSVVAGECLFEKKNQHIKSSFKVVASPVMDKESNVKNVILLFDDQTNIKESRQAHIDFVSNVSHELKTPLTAVQGYVDMLIQDCAKKKWDQFENFLPILLRNCKRMSRLVDDLLNLSNLVSQSDGKKEKLDTKKITQQVMERINTEDRKIDYDFSAPFVMGQRTWVEMVLYNLVDNACRHTPKDRPVSIVWEPMKTKGVMLKVVDSGGGISEKYRQRVFERFFRIDPARSRKQGGTGVGLALVKQSMEKQGGSARVLSSSSGGAEFICEFPTS